jgi:hypothetical protein
MVPSENRRLPDPMTRGKTQRRYSSTRLWGISVWIRFPLPWTLQLRPVLLLQRRDACGCVSLDQGPPGACMTPSRVKKVLTISFLISHVLSIRCPARVEPSTV